MRDPDPDTHHWKTSRDAAQRMYDTLHTHREALSLLERLQGQNWVAIRLSDGGSDGQLYDTRQLAMHHQLHPTMCGYLPIKPQMPGLVACDTLLWYWRGAYERGWRPDEDRDAHHLHLPMALELTRAAERGPDRR